MISALTDHLMTVIECCILGDAANIKSVSALNSYNYVSNFNYYLSDN